MERDEYMDLIKKVSGEMWTIYKQNTFKYDPLLGDEPFAQFMDEIDKYIKKYKGSPAESYVYRYIMCVVIPDIEWIQFGNDPKKYKWGKMPGRKMLEESYNKGFTEGYNKAKNEIIDNQK